jgi:hypothetical protein
MQPHALERAVDMFETALHHLMLVPLRQAVEVVGPQTVARYQAIIAIKNGVLQLYGRFQGGVSFGLNGGSVKK